MYNFHRKFRNESMINSETFNNAFVFIFYKSVNVIKIKRFYFIQLKNRETYTFWWVKQ